MASAQILSHEVTGLRRDFYAPKDVCETMGHKHSLIVTARPPAELDCMGRMVQLTDFCQKIEKSGLSLLRGRLDPLTDQVICEYGDGLVFSMRCHSGNSKYCEDAQSGCKGIQDVFAKGLRVSHAALLPDGGDHRLNCYFSHAYLNDEVQKIIPPLSEVESL